MTWKSCSVMAVHAQADQTSVGPTVFRGMLACDQCDTLYHYPVVEEGESAVCDVCGAKLLSHTRRGLHRATALSVAALFLFIISNFFPFMTIIAAGRENTVTVMDTIKALWDYNDPILAATVFAFIIAIPLIVCLCQLYILVPLMWGKILPFARVLCRFGQSSVPWSMTEVFFLGVLVSLLKLLALARVEFRVGFWAFAALMVCLTAALTAIDRRELWRLLNPT